MQLWQHGPWLVVQRNWSSSEMHGKLHAIGHWFSRFPRFLKNIYDQHPISCESLHDLHAWFFWFQDAKIRGEEFRLTTWDVQHLIHTELVNYQPQLFGFWISEPSTVGDLYIDVCIFADVESVWGFFFVESNIDWPIELEHEKSTETCNLPIYGDSFLAISPCALISKCSRHEKIDCFI